MTTRTVTAVEIIFSDIDRIIFNFFAELFRLVGIYVGECNLEDGENRDKDRWMNAHQIILYITSNEIDNDSMIRVDPASFAGLDMIRTNQDKYLKAAQTVLDTIQQWATSHYAQFPYEIISDVLPLYMKNNVLKGAMQLQYYRLKTELNREAEDIFQNTWNDLQNIRRTSKHLAYAKLYCRQKVNLACYFQYDRHLAYAISDLVRECDELIARYPEYSNANVLKGMICERSKDGVKLAIDAYKTVLPHITSRSCAAHVYYWLGLLYEMYDGSHVDAVQSYVCSYEQEPNYQNIYKRGYMAEVEKNYEEAVRWYKECLCVLEKKIPAVMDPLEIEYYYKTGVLICFHSQKYLKNYNQVIEFGEKMMDFYQRVFETNTRNDFEYFYGTDAPRHKEASRRRIKCKKLYECIAISYREVGNVPESEKYWAMADKC